MDKDSLAKKARILNKALQLVRKNSPTPEKDSLAVIYTALQLIADEQIAADAKYLAYRSEMCYKDAERTAKIWGVDDAQAKAYRDEGSILRIVAFAMLQGRSDSELMKTIERMGKDG